jgi:hypothetical protein
MDGGKVVDVYYVLRCDSKTDEQSVKPSPGFSNI